MSESARDAPDGDVWIFGYGSLVWRPAFSHVERHAALVRGWQRHFWQGSIDHRGVPGAPGRVVTVLPNDGAKCWGRVYRVDARERSAVLAVLDHREKGGYLRCEVEAELVCGRRICALLYAATPENPNYLGPAPLDEIARQVCASEGPSGPNVEYVFELAAALRAMRVEDAHVFELEARVRAELAE